MVDCGHTTTCISPFAESYFPSHAAKRLGVGGTNVNDRLASLLATNLNLIDKIKPDVITDINEQLCFCAGDYAKELGRRYSPMPVPSILKG